MNKIQSSLLVVATIFGLPVFAETKSFEVGEIAQFVQGPSAVHPRENPIGSMRGLSRVEFAIAFVNDELQFYATLYDSPDHEMSFNVSAGIYSDEDQLIGQFRPSPTIHVPPNTALFPMGGAIYKVQGDFDRLKRADLENINDLRLEVTWFERNET